MSKIVLALLVASFLLVGCSDEQVEQKVPKEILKVDTITVEKKPVAFWVKYTARTKASNKQEIISRVSGILQKRYIRDGEIVHKGQKLFLIQQDEYQAALQAAQAKLAEDKAALSLASANVRRYAPLVQEGLAPRATLEQYQAQVAKLEATIEGDKARIQEAKLNLSYTLITAPTSGKVSSRRVDVGNIVDAKTAEVLTTIVKVNPIYAYFSPSQKDVMMFSHLANEKKPYAFVEIDTPFGKKRYTGSVDFSDNVVDPLTSTITMRATIKNPKNELLPGSFVYVHIFLTDSIPFLMIPPHVILNDQLGKYLYVVDKNNKVKRVNITTGYRTKYYASVKSGLKNGDRVIVSSLMKIQEGIEVIPTDSTKSQGVDAILEQNKLIPKKVQ